MGTPKALVDDWLVRSVDVLRDGGCDDVTVVLGAAAEQARLLLADTPVRVVVAQDWAQGMGASLRAGLTALEEYEIGDAALINLVDLPDVSADVVRRVLAGPVPEPGPPASGSTTRSVAAVLRRASYDGVPGHPVLLGHDHWSAIRDSALGDRGARAYLEHEQVESVECADLATGQDVDAR